MTLHFILQPASISLQPNLCQSAEVHSVGPPKLLCQRILWPKSLINPGQHLTATSGHHRFIFTVPKFLASTLPKSWGRTAPPPYPCESAELYSCCKVVREHRQPQSLDPQGKCGPHVGIEVGWQSSVVNISHGLKPVLSASKLWSYWCLVFGLSVQNVSRTWPRWGRVSHVSGSPGYAAHDPPRPPHLN